jgi:hypothetical protein
MTRVVQFPTISSGQRVSAPFSIANARDLGLIIPTLDANPGSTMAVQIHAALAAAGATPLSASYMPIQKNDGSGVWQITTAGSVAVALGEHVRGFDQVRIFVSSALAANAAFQVVQIV